MMILLLLLSHTITLSSENSTSLNLQNVHFATSSIKSLGHSPTGLLEKFIEASHLPLVDIDF